MIAVLAEEKKDIKQEQGQQGERSFVEIQDDVIEALRTVYDPEIPVNIYELGLIYEVKVDPGNNVHIIMTLTSPACPVAGSLPGEVEEKVKTVKGVNSATVELTFDPPWDQDMMSEVAKFELGFM